MAIASGKTGSITISTARPYDNFSIDFQNEVIDTTNFTSSGYAESVAGVFQARISFSGPYDGSESISQGAALATVFVTGSAVSLTITTRVESVKIETAVRNKADTISVTGISTGSYSVTL